MSVHRDHLLLHTLLARVRRCTASASVLRCTDGLAADGLLIGRAIKRDATRRVAVTRQVVRGTTEQIQSVLVTSLGKAEAAINTADIETGQKVNG